MFPPALKDSHVDMDDHTQTQTVEKDVRAISSSAAAANSQNTVQPHYMEAEDMPTQVIDEDFTCKVVTTGQEKVQLMTNGGQSNSDDLCTQIFPADDHVKGDPMAAVAGSQKIPLPVDTRDKLPTQVFSEFSANDLQTQVFEELTESVEPLSKGKKAGGRGKKTGKRGLKEVAAGNVDNLETQVFDGFVAPDPPSGKTALLQSDVADEGRGYFGAGGRRTRDRMSVKGTRNESSDDKAADVSDRSSKVDVPSSVDDLATQVFEPNSDISVTPRGRRPRRGTRKESRDLTAEAGVASSASVQDGSPKARSTVDDLATQVFEPSSDVSAFSRGRMSVKGLQNVTIVPDTSPKARSAVDELATQVFESNSEVSSVPSTDSVPIFGDVPSQSCAAAPIVSGKVAGSSNCKPTEKDEEPETQVFDEAEDEKNAVSSWLSDRGTKAAATGMKTYQRAVRRGKKSVAAGNQPGLVDGTDLSIEMDDVATQVFDANPPENMSKAHRTSVPQTTHAEADDENIRSGNVRRSRATSGSTSDLEAAAKLDMPQDRDEKSSPRRDEGSKCRRLSSRSIKGKHPAKDALLTTVPESDGDNVVKGHAARSKVKTSLPTNPSGSNDNARQPPFPDDEVNTGRGRKATSLSAVPENATKSRAGRSQGKRAKPPVSDVIPEPASDIEKSDVSDYKVLEKPEGAEKPAARRRNKKESAQAGKPARSSASHQKAAKDSIDNGDGAEAVTVKSPAAKEVSETPLKKTRKLYTAKGVD